MRPDCEFVPVGQLQLAQHIRNVGLNGLHGNIEPLRDLSIAVGARQMLENLPFAFRQLVEFRIDFGEGNRREGFQHEPGQLWREHGMALRHSADCRREILG